MSNWIKCDDDLPKQNRVFLVTAESTWTKERSVGIGRYSVEDEDFITNEHWLDFEIVAWQEIPKPFVEAAPIKTENI